MIALRQVCAGQVVLPAELSAAEGFVADHGFGPGVDSEEAAVTCGGLAGREVPADRARAGLAVLVRVPMVSVFPYHDLPGGAAEESSVRRGLCAHTARPTTVRVCVAHVDEGAAGDEQLRQLGVQWQLAEPMQPTIVVGDLGFEPSAGRLSPLYASPVGDGVFHEVAWCGEVEPGVACPSPSREGVWTREDGAGRVRTDHVFVDSAHFAPEVSSRVVVDDGECGGLRCSAHRLLWGRVSLRVVPDAVGTRS